MAGRKVYFSVDLSDMQETINFLSRELTPREMRILTYRVFKRVGAGVKTIVSKEVPKHYEIKKNVVAADIKNPRMHRGSGMDAGCVIPIEGERHIIGGNTFKADGGTYGFRGIKAGRRYKITTNIVKGKTSTLPDFMDHQGGHPPFRNIGAKRLNNATFTRAFKAGKPPKPNNFPIYRVTGLAVPQMPINLAEKDVQAEIIERLKKRIDHEYGEIMKMRNKKAGVL